MAAYDSRDHPRPNKQQCQRDQVVCPATTSLPNTLCLLIEPPVSLIFLPLDRHLNTGPSSRPATPNSSSHVEAESQWMVVRHQPVTPSPVGQGLMGYMEPWSCCRPWRVLRETRHPHRKRTIISRRDHPRLAALLSLPLSAAARPLAPPITPCARSRSSHR
jgi:hypothetical protein